MFKTLDEHVFPNLRTSPTPIPIQFIIRPQAQPWDPTSPLAVETSLAINALAPLDSEKFWSFAKKIFNRQEDFHSVKVVKEKRNETYVRLAKIAEDSTGLRQEDVLDLIRLPEEPASDRDDNQANKIVMDFKAITRVSRLTFRSLNRRH